MYLLVGTLGIITIVCIVLLHRYSAFFSWHLGKASVRRILNVNYMPGNNIPRQKLDVYQPKHTAGSPIVIFIHGGYWNSGSKNYRQWLTGLYGNIGSSLAKYGIITVIPNYRLIPRASIEEQIADIVAAIKFAVSNASSWGGNGQIIVMGHSSGAHIATLLASNPDFYGNNPPDINGYIALSPILDIASMAATHDKTFNANVTYPAFGKDVSKWQNYSPMHHFLHRQHFTKPLLLAVGSKDFRYIANHTSKFHKKLQKAGINADLSVIPEYNHTDMVVHFGRRRDPLVRQVADFITDKV